MQTCLSSINSVSAYTCDYMDVRLRVPVRGFGIWSLQAGIAVTH